MFEIKHKQINPNIAFNEFLVSHLTIHGCEKEISLILLSKVLVQLMLI